MDVVRNRLRGQSSGSPRGSMPSFEKMKSAAEEMVQDQPIITTLAAFGIGLGVGAALGVALAECWSESDWKRGPRDTRSDFEKITQHVMDRVAAFVPDAVARHFRGS